MPAATTAGAYNAVGFSFSFLLLKCPMLNIDLHCHSVVSDGTLSPGDLARRAAANGVDVWALTDHDEVGGIAEARAVAHFHYVCWQDGAYRRFGYR